MSKRKSLSKKLRFEVFKRDKFTCQYCGKQAPSVVLNVDHITPVAKGGEDDITNLITACFDCNMGKKDIELSDDTTIQKRKAQLDELQERREQLEMMLDWQRGLLNIKEIEVDKVCEFFAELIRGSGITQDGRNIIKGWVKKYGLAEVLESMRIASEQYSVLDANGEHTHASTEKIFNYTPRICATRKRMEDKPYLRDLYMIRGILRNRMGYVNEWMAIALLEKAYVVGCGIDELDMLARTASNWTNFRQNIEGWIDERGE